MTRLAAAILFLWLAGCAGITGVLPEPTEGLRLLTRGAPTTVRAGERVFLWVGLQNASNQPVALLDWNGTSHTLHLPDGTGIGSARGGAAHACKDARAMRLIGPGETVFTGHAFEMPEVRGRVALDLSRSVVLADMDGKCLPGRGVVLDSVRLEMMVE